VGQKRLVGVDSLTGRLDYLRIASAPMDELADDPPARRLQGACQSVR
jgi:hypothetical protein